MEECIRMPDVRNVALRVICVCPVNWVCLCVFLLQTQRSIEELTPAPLIVSSFLGDRCVWVSVFAVSSPWEISSCLKRFPLHWLCFRLLDLHRISCLFDGAFVGVKLRSSLGFLQPIQQGLTWKCCQDVLFSKRLPSLYLSILQPWWVFPLIPEFTAVPPCWTGPRL